MNIGQAAEASGVSAKMIRYYESTGLIGPVGRTDAGYRDLGDADVHKLRFIRRARDLGFSVSQIENLLSLWQDRARSSAEVKRLALQHVERLQGKVTELQTMIDTLARLSKQCTDDDRPDCPILRDLEAGLGDDGTTPTRSRFGVSNH